MVGLAENWAEDSKGCGMVEDCAEGNSRWLDWWEICWECTLVEANWWGWDKLKRNLKLDRKTDGSMMNCEEAFDGIDSRKECS